MKKADLGKYPLGTFEYVVMHARWRSSRGKRPSATLPWKRDPRKALAWSKRFAYFPLEGGLYLGGEIPEWYRCERCGATNCKLWREYQTCSPTLLCATCAAKDQGKDISDIDAKGKYSSDPGDRTDQIGWYVPAIPVEDAKAYWGYTSVPFFGCKWWEKLATLPDLFSQLTELFTGKRVRITHTNERVEDAEGLCLAVHEVPGTPGHFDIELESRSRFGFVPEVIRKDSVDGKLHAFAGGHRRIEVI
jgi:hypothetical protein